MYITVCMYVRSTKIGKAAADTTIGKKAQEVGNTVKDRIEGTIDVSCLYVCMYVCMYALQNKNFIILFM